MKLSRIIEQLRLFEDENTRFNDFLLRDNHGRLSEAIYRLTVETESHSYWLIAKEEVAELHAVARLMGMKANEFKNVCDWVIHHPFRTKEGEVFIETPLGNKIYNGISAIALGEGSFPSSSLALRDMSRTALQAAINLS